ncbi:MAG: DUF2330 domain-containing protein [Deltaproteobacteria bacterium]|nr:DUF2330 domain-containing protein [Candidatus Zymogenaceae bacterium]
MITKKPTVVSIRILTAVVAMTIFLFFGTPSRADRGALPITLEANISLYEPAQRGLIAFNGTEELLVLATETNVSTKTDVIEFLPLPSPPDAVFEADTALFERVFDLIEQNAPRIFIPFYDEDGMMRGGEERTLEGISVVMTATVGVHDVTVVEVTDADAFFSWLTDFYAARGIDALPGSAARFTGLVQSYLDRDIRYFVFDVVSLDETPRGATPLAYRFKTNSLYYPLAITSNNRGDGTVDLFLMTPGTPKPEALPAGFSFALYRAFESPSPIEDESAAVPISFPVSMVDRVAVWPELATMLPGWESDIHLTAVTYDGPLRSLNEDLVLGWDDFENTDFDGVAEAGGSAHDLIGPGGAADLALTSIDANDPHTILIGGNNDITAPAAADGDPSTPYTLPVSGTWWIDLGEVKSIHSIEILAASIEPDIEPSANTIYLYVSENGKFSGEEKRLERAVVTSHTDLMASDPTRLAERLTIRDKPFEARWLMITYPYSESMSSLYLFEVMIWENGPGTDR